MMPRSNKKHIDVAALLLAKSQERDRLARQRQDRVQDTLAWVLAFCVVMTMILVIVSIQEGWL